jgi:hypothetical protein
LEQEQTMARQDPAEESMELVSARQRAEVERLTERLKSESDRAAASIRLLDSVVGTVMGLARETSEVATQAFDLTATVDGLMSRTDRVMHELYYVQMESGKGEPAAMLLLARQLLDIAKALQIEVGRSEDTDIQEMRDQGEDEREQGEQRRELEHQQRARSIFNDDSGMG